MKIEIDHIIPVPLKDRLIQRSSDIWNRRLSLQKGEYIKIKAPSGTGKTTFIHILYHLRGDFTGNILLGGKNIFEYNSHQLATVRQQQLSIIFQDLRLFPQLTARENIELKRILQAPVKEVQEIDKMAAELGITHILDQQAGICSYGEQQRIAIIRALMQPFDWLIMDEPFSHLDTENTNRAADLINRECRERGAGLLITDLEDDEHFRYDRYYNL